MNLAQRVVAIVAALVLVTAGVWAVVAVAEAPAPYAKSAHDPAARVLQQLAVMWLTTGIGWAGLHFALRPRR